MEPAPKTGSFTPAGERYVNAARVFAFVLAAGAIVGGVGRGHAPDEAIVVLFLVAGGAFAVFFADAVWWGRAIARRPAVALGFETIATAVAIAMTGGLSSPFVVFMFAAVLTAALRYGVRETVAATVGQAVGFGVATFLVGQWATALVAVAFNIGFLALVGMLAIFVAQEFTVQATARHRLRSVTDAASGLRGHRSVADAARALVPAARAALPVDGAIVHVANEGGALECVACDDVDEERWSPAAIARAVTAAPFTVVPAATRAEQAAVYPLRAEDRLVGTLTLTKQGPDVFLPMDLELGAAFAHHAAASLASAALGAAVEDREERLARLVAGAPVLLAGVAPDGTVTTLDGRLPRGLGLRLDALVGRPVENVFAALPGFAEAARRALEGVAAKRTARLDGTVYDVQATPRRDGGVVVVATEVTDRDQSTQAVARAEARWRALLESVPPVIMTVASDGRVATLNRAIGEATAQDSIGKRALDVFPAAGRDDLEAALRTAFGTAQSSSFETVWPSDAGEGWCNVRVVAVPGDDPVVAVVATDVTDLKRTEAKFRGLLEGAPDAMVIVGDDGRVVLVNSQVEKLFGYGRHELLGERVEVLVPDAVQGTHRGHREAYMGDAHSRPMGAGLALEGRRKDGSTFPVEVSLSPMQSPEGRFVTAAIRDVSDRQRSEEERQTAFARVKELERIEEISDMRTELVNTIAHEMSTPLTPIKMQLHLLKASTERDPDARRRRAVDVLDRNFERLALLVKDALDVARLQSGSLGIEARPIDLHRVAHEAVESFRAAATAAGIELRLAGRAGVVLNADPLRVSQVLFNLISNAMKFTDRGGAVTVTVSVMPNEDGARVTVVDTGAGFDPADAVRLFRPFSQLEHTDRSQTPGTGLGLYICKGIVELHGGQIWCQSKGRGLGALFGFMLPRRAVTAENDGDAAANTPRAPTPVSQAPRTAALDARTNASAAPQD